MPNDDQPRHADIRSEDSEERRGFKGQIIAKAPEERTEFNATRMLRERVQNINRNFKQFLKER